MNRQGREVNLERKVDVVEDLDGKKTVFIHDILFKGKRPVRQRNRLLVSIRGKDGSIRI